jgi:hypothetical protein
MQMKSPSCPAPTRRPLDQGGFSNLRVVGITGVSLALMAANPFGRGTVASPASPAKIAQLQQKYGTGPKSDSLKPFALPFWFDCSKIHELGFDRMENFKAQAVLIACGQGGGKPFRTRAFSKLVEHLLPQPLAYGGADVDLVTGPETFPNVTQSETFTTANPDNPNQIVVAFNDSRDRPFGGWNASGAAVSTDGGTTFTRLIAASGRSPFDATLGDPVVLYNKASGTWFTVWLDCDCGGSCAGFPSVGLGGYKTTTPQDPNSWTHYCIHNGINDDRESGWADNNPSSPFYGNIYVSWNDFSVGANIFVARSTDHGLTWSSPIQVSNHPDFIRNVQITGDAATGVLYIAGMNEGDGGFPHDDANLFFRSTDGGATWTNTYIGPTFPGPGVTAVGYFTCMFPDNGGYWRHMGWGQPAALNGNVHYVYAQHGAGSDPGDVYYIRSTDMGQTFSTPLKLNTDVTSRPQWQPNLSVSDSGTLLAMWYDARESANCAAGNPNVPCYRMWARKSFDNGVTWLADDAFSDVVSPLPAQVDPGIQPTYAGDYDYGSAISSKHLTSWTDGRMSISNQSQQDAFTDRDLVGFAVANSNPGCGSVLFTQPTTFDVTVTDPVQPASLQTSDFEVNGIQADNVSYTPGDLVIHFSYNTSPVTVQGVQSIHVAAGAFLSDPDGDPVLEFNCTFRYDVLQLTVAATVPPLGGTFTLPPEEQQLQVNFNEEVDSTSVQTGDLRLSGINGTLVTNVTISPDNMSATFDIRLATLGMLTASIPAGAITDQFGNPNAAFSGNYTVAGCANAYVIAQGTDTIVPGDTRTPSDCDDCDTLIALPFPFRFYGTTYTAVNASSNGRLDFVTANEPDGFLTSCLPPPPNIGPYDFTIFGLWQDMFTFSLEPGCAVFPGGTCGIYTSVTGTAPNRIFNIEWRTVLYINTFAPQNFEIRLYENPSSQRFDIVYGNIDSTDASQTYVGGVQGANNFVTEDFCSAMPPTNVSRTYQILPCGSPTPTITPSGTPTATPRPTPTPRGGVTPRTRPTPAPRP